MLMNAESQKRRQPDFWESSGLGFDTWAVHLDIWEAALRRNTQHFPGGPVVKILFSNEGGVGLIPGWGTKVPCAMGCGQKI